MLQIVFASSLMLLNHAESRYILLKNIKQKN
jgi:hypothetical protein